MSEPPVPPFSVELSVRGESWLYVIRALERAIEALAEDGPRASIISGGGGGSMSLSVRTRDVSTEQYRNELADWHKESSS